jgi:outer membrane protein assembly factor BamB
MLALMLVLLPGLAILGGCSSSPSPMLPPVALTPIKPTLAVRVAWNGSLGYGVGDNYLQMRPVFDQDTGYGADYTGYVRAFGIRSGTTRWERQLHRPLEGGPALAAGKLLFGTSKGEVLALEPASGKLLWRTEVSSEVIAPPQGEAGVIVVRSVDGRVHGLDADDGHRLWIYDRSVPLLTLRGNSAPVISNGIVLVGTDNGKLAALTLKNGTLLWETRIAEPRGRTDLDRMVDIDATPVVMDDVVYAVSYQGRLAAVQLGNGRILWSREMSSYSGLVLDPYRVYLSDADSQIWALNRFTGATLWRQDKLLRRDVTAPVLQGPYLVVGDYDGYVHWLKREDGRIVARRRVNEDWFMDNDEVATPDPEFRKEHNILAAPLNVDHMVIVLDRRGNLAAFKTGDE